MFKTFPVVLDITKHQLNDMFQVNSNDLNTVRLNLSIKSGLDIFDLTGKIVRIAIKKPDGFIAFQTGGVTDPSNGLCEFILDRQAYLVEGKHEAEVMIYQDDSTVIVTERFYYKVNRAIVNDKTLLSTNHLPAINQAIIAGEQLKDIDIPEFVEAANSAYETIEEAETQGLYAKGQGDYAKQEADRAALRITELNGVDAVQFKDRQDDFENKTSAFVNLAQFKSFITGLGTANEDWTNVIQTAINSLNNKGGTVLVPLGVKIPVWNTITLKRGVTLKSYSTGKWTDTGTIYFKGLNKPCINFDNIIAGASIENIKITTTNTDANYQSFTGVDVTRAEDVTLKNVIVENANVGYDLSATTGAIYLLNMEGISAFNCKNQGILIRPQTGVNDWKNGIRINPRDISGNKIGIEAGTGEGNIIEGKATEIGGNTECGIKLTGGKWILTGPLWLENSPFGLYVTGGDHIIDGDIRNLSENYCDTSKASLTSNAKQFYRGVVDAGIPLDAAFWFSFNEQYDTHLFNKAKNNLIAKSGTAGFSRVTDGLFGGSQILGNGNLAILPTTNMANDWSLLVCAKRLDVATQQVSIMTFRTDDNSTTFYIKFNIGVNNKPVIQLYNTAGFVGNLTVETNLINEFGWIALSYDSANKKLNTHKMIGTIDSSINADFSACTTGNLLNVSGSNQVCFDELMLFTRKLKVKEFQNLMSLKTIPNEIANNRSYYADSVPANFVKNGNDIIINTNQTPQKNILHWKWNGSKWFAYGTGSGTSAQRPALTVNDEGYNYYDTTMNKMIYWNGTSWSETETESYLKSPDGSRFKLTIGNDGAITTTKL